MKVALIPCSPSDWAQEGRILGRTELPPSDGATATVAGLIDTLRPIAPSKLYHAPDELSTHAAKAIAKALKLTAKSIEELVEVDMGLWAGLTDEQLRARFSSAYYLLEESPLNISPPGGENFRDAAERLERCLATLLRRAGTGPIAVVLRPIVLQILRYRIIDNHPELLWNRIREGRYAVEIVEYPVR